MRLPEDNEFGYTALPSLPEEDFGTPDLLASEQYELCSFANLDDFFQRIYRYHQDKGFQVILVSQILNLLALGFTIAFSALLLLCVRWGAFHAECVEHDTCDISEVAFDLHPLQSGFTFWNIMAVMYLSIFTAYWLYNLVHMLLELRAAAAIRSFTTDKLGLSERQLRAVTWPEVVRRIVQAQEHTRLCAVRDLGEHDVVSRVMRRENYLIGMLNRGCLALNVPLPGLRKHFMMTKTLEWSLQWCLLGAMFDKDFRIHPEFIADERKLQRRFRRMAVLNLLLAPFLLVFLVIYFFMRNAEKFYNHPSAVGARRWSPLALWRLREFNELPHYVTHRLNASQRAAERYVMQFPSPVLSAISKFVAFVAGSFAAVLLFLALAEDTLVERRLFDRTLVWWGATLGIVLAISRAFIGEDAPAHEPELALLEVTAHTHHLPRHWRGRAHTREVQQQFASLFQFKALLFMEELASIVLTPFVLYWSLPACVPSILAFVRDFTVHVEGVGDICSLAAFDFARHGNPKYGSPAHAPKTARSRQGKMEKSLLSFATTYPTWEPGVAAKQLLAAVSEHPLQAGPHFPYTAHASQFHPAMRAQEGYAGAWQGVQASNLDAQGLRDESAGGGAATGAGPAHLHMHASIFASADMTRSSATLAGPSASQLSESEQRIALGQMMMQSLYDDRERTSRLSGYPANTAPRTPLTANSPHHLWSSGAAAPTSYAAQGSHHNPTRVPTIPHAQQHADVGEASASSPSQPQRHMHRPLHWADPGAGAQHMQAGLDQQMSHNPDSGFFLAEGEHPADVGSRSGVENGSALLRRGGGSGSHASHPSRQHTDQALELADLSARNTQDVEADVESLLRHVQ
ncbi:hypothetical protein WJX73_002447 [Symbiochloris irregularis]|uniref:Autophagy-related protein 9 n=1 Tax=Symbiochloris irregularis TaxID=706552 RepID=A0AAW1P0J6_9CHLO